MEYWEPIHGTLIPQLEKLKKESVESLAKMVLELRVVTYKCMLDFRRSEYDARKRVAMNPQATHTITAANAYKALADRCAEALKRTNRE